MFYVTEDGRLTNELQGLYVMAIAFGMAEGEERTQFASRLDALIKEADYHLGTAEVSLVVKTVKIRHRPWGTFQVRYPSLT